MYQPNSQLLLAPVLFTRASKSAVGSLHPLVCAISKETKVKRVNKPVNLSQLLTREADPECHWPNRAAP
jgi:hypothetical protein